MRKSKMKTIQLRTDGKAVEVLKQFILFDSIILILMPVLIWGSGSTATPGSHGVLPAMFISGTVVLGVSALMTWLYSKYSPIKSLKIRKNLIQFTRLFLKSETDGMLFHSVKWQYALQGKKTIIDLYPNGLVNDTAKTGKELAQFIDEPLLKYEESDRKARYTFGVAPKRYDGMGLMGEGISGITGRYMPMISYEPIPIYDEVVWDFNSEALHILLIAPSGSGKSWLLTYLAGMALKRQHRVYMIDAKNSLLGRIFRHAGVQVATNIEEILELLTVLVDGMEERYAKYFASGQMGMGEGIELLGLEGHFLFFDEILSVLNSADKKERAEMERLLGQLALKGRAAGFSLVITAQKLNASDLPKAITEQCQTRIILGGLVSEETFHQATGVYKKDIATMYRGGVGQGYAVTPKSGGLTYIETPLLPRRLEDCTPLLRELRDRGTPYGTGH